MKLKTLKDLEEEIRLRCKWAGEEDTKVAFVLLFVKAEAIKWGKEIIQQQIDRGRWKEGSKCNQSSMSPRKQGQLSFIKRFFNITEDDLK